jgi:hypothetical protein
VSLQQKEGKLKNPRNKSIRKRIKALFMECLINFGNKFASSFVTSFTESRLDCQMQLHSVSLEQELLYHHHHCKTFLSGLHDKRRAGQPFHAMQLHDYKSLQKGKE